MKGYRIVALITFIVIITSCVFDDPYRIADSSIGLTRIDGKYFLLISICNSETVEYIELGGGDQMGASKFAVIYPDDPVGNLVSLDLTGLIPPGSGLNEPVLPFQVVARQTDGVVVSMFDSLPGEGEVIFRTNFDDDLNQDLLNQDAAEFQVYAQHYLGCNPD